MKTYQIYLNINGGKRFISAEWHPAATVRAKSKREAIRILNEFLAYGANDDYVLQITRFATHGGSFKAEIL
jgi:ribulose bisphosphate carboxylase small subunit